MLKLYKWPDGSFTVCSGTKEDHLEMLDGVANYYETRQALALRLDKFAITFCLPKKVEHIDRLIPEVVFDWFNDEFAEVLQTLYPKYAEAAETLESERVDQLSTDDSRFV